MLSGIQWSTVSILVATLASNAVAQQPFNISVSDQSPTITYSPAREGTTPSIWQVSFDGNPGPYTPDQIPNGPSAHSTDFVGAGVKIGFMGTACYAWGSAVQGGVEMRVAGEAPVIAQGSAGGMIAKVEGLPYGWHEAVLRVLAGQVVLTGFTVTSQAGELG
jgi:hypothetical protein